MAPRFFLFAFYVAFFLGLACAGKICDGSEYPCNQPKTVPTEVRALNIVFDRWNIKATTTWNLSGEPCSGAALNSTRLNDQGFNPFIKCDCSYESLCHITQLKVYAKNIVGPIPEELWTLTFLSNLNLAGNYLTGPLSPCIGNLTHLIYLRLGTNALSGEIPKEMGQLAKLKTLCLGPNNFSGPLPSALGNLSMLERLYIDSSGVSGEIPPSFAQLQNLNTLWASDIELTGKIPKFIGHWQKLKTLRLQGNLFEGPIPSTFSNLKSLADLRISELSHGNCSLEFLKDMKSINVLALRNNKISHPVPTYIGGYRYLTHLDLSFNNIQGQIPKSLFNMRSLSSLFLGNNSLSGTLPEQKRESLVNIDLSHNKLAGSLPPWVNQPNLQLNLVGNNFKTEDFSSSVLPFGLNCLQRNFPCNRGHGIYNNVMINCGGPQITSPDGSVLYEGDNETLGPATYFVHKTQRWAVSAVGFLTKNNDPRFHLELLQHQAARVSTSSLKYFILGLENGNYTVNLLFKDDAFRSPATLKSVQRRVFDILIQGNLMLKDFDIQKKADFVSSGVDKEFKAQVSENYLEIHLFWAGKGTCCVPVEGTYGPSISAIKVTPDFITVDNQPSANDQYKIILLFVAIISVGLGVLLIVFLPLNLYLAFTKNSGRDDRHEGLEMSTARPNGHTFAYAELKAATNNFSRANRLGGGAFGGVYMGRLADGRAIAVKRSEGTISDKERDQFQAEITVLSGVVHDNVVKLYGWCTEEGYQLLVYEYMENNSLQKCLFGTGRDYLPLEWSTRCDICLGIAQGLAYLHEGGRIPIIHNDIKPANILLDSHLTPKIADFGLARFYEDERTHVSTNNVAGTLGYIAPEYVLRGHLNEKNDTYAFGVVILETISGRKCVETRLDGKISLVEWARHLHDYQNHEVLKLVDPRVRSSPDFDEEEAKSVIEIALLCTQASPPGRPSMPRVVAMLSGDVRVNTSGISRRGAFPPVLEETDRSSIMTNTATRGTDSTLYDGTSTSTAGYGLTSPAN